MFQVYKVDTGAWLKVSAQYSMLFIVIYPEVLPHLWNQGYLSSGLLSYFVRA